MLDVVSAVVAVVNHALVFPLAASSEEAAAIAGSASTALHTSACHC